MTERGRGCVSRDAASLAIGPSSLRWDGGALTFSIDEITAPLPSRIRGEVRIHPEALFERSYTLDEEGVHRWRPMAPAARVEVALDRPGLRWSGSGYFDSNAGDAPLENAFSGWHWSRARLRRGTAVAYDLRGRDGAERSLAMHFLPNGSIEDMPLPPAAALPSTKWGIARAARAGAPVRVSETLEDTPFYARSLLSAWLLGEPVTAVHESLSLDRFRAPWVQLMLSFRMPRSPL
jgi:carotenoid 1,2-hydratase